MGAPVKLTTHEADALSQLAIQWRISNKEGSDPPERVQAVITDIIGGRAQEFENVVWDFLLTRFLADDGVTPLPNSFQLDQFGRLIGQDRFAADDTTMIRYLRARILANQSGGTIPDLYAVFKTLWVAPGTVKIRESPPPTVWLDLYGKDMDATTRLVFAKFLAATKAAGVRGSFNYAASPVAQMFKFQPTNYSRLASLSSGPDTLTFYMRDRFNLTRWPAAGTVEIAAGQLAGPTGHYYRLNYSARANFPNPLGGVISGLVCKATLTILLPQGGVNAGNVNPSNVDGECITLYDRGAGHGFADSGQTQGGKLAGVIEV